MSNFVQEDAVCFQSRMSKLIIDITGQKDALFIPGIAFTFYRI